MKKNKLSIDLTEDDVPNIKSLSDKELETVPFDLRKWFCCVKGCNGFIRVKDFGALPDVYWRKKWMRLTRMIFYCSKHWKLFKADNNSIPLDQYKDGNGVNHLENVCTNNRN